MAPSEGLVKTGLGGSDVAVNAEKEPALQNIWGEYIKEWRVRLWLKASYFY